MEEYRVFIFKVLSAIGYSGDQDEFFERFMHNVYLESAMDLIASSEGVKKYELQKNMSSSVKNFDDFFRIIAASFSSDEIARAMQKNISVALQKYVEIVFDSLTETQQNELEAILKGAAV